MTADAGVYTESPPRQHFNLWTWVRAQVDKASYRPQAAPGIVVRRLAEDSVAYYVLKNPKVGTYLRLSEQDYLLWCLMDGSRSVKDLVVAYFERYKVLAIGRVTALVDELRAAGFLVDKPVGMYRQAAEQLAVRDWSHRWQQVARSFLQREFTVDHVDQFVTLVYRMGGRVLFWLPVLALLTLMALAGLAAFVILLGRKTYPILAADDATVPGYVAGLLTLLILNLAMVFIHEMAHALTTKHYGREVRRGGLMIYYGMPAFFVDTVDVWLEPKQRRMAVSWAGPHAELIVAGLCSLLALGIADPASLIGGLLFKAAFLAYFSVFLNLNPLLELDGYYILSDWLGIPMLRQRSFAFIREELPAKVAAMLPPELHALRPAQPAAKAGEGTTQAVAFTREELIFTLFGGLAALYTVYALAFALYFWQTRVWNVLVDLWNKDPALLFKPLVALMVTLVVVPASLALGATLWNAGRRLADWLERRRFFERESNMALLAAGALVLILLAPLFAGGSARGPAMIAGSILLAGLAVWTLAHTARQYTGAEFQDTFWGLALAAGLWLLGALLRGLDLALIGGPLSGAASGLALWAEQLAPMGMLIAAIRSLVGVDLRRGRAWERAAMVGLLALGFVVVLPIARWTAGWRLVEALPAVASAYFTLVFLALILPTLTAYAGTRFSVPWATLTLAAVATGLLNVARIAPTWRGGTAIDAWLGLAVAALWGIGGLSYATAGGRLSFPVPRWNYGAAVSEEERLRTAFARFFETLFRCLHIILGARRAQAVDDELDIMAVAADWDVEIDAGRVRDELDLSQVSILQQADRYREVLAKTMDLIDNWAGSRLAARMAQVAYDHLPWPERETLGRYVLAGTPWGSALAERFASACSERDRLLRAVPYFARLSSHDFYLLQAALEQSEAPAGRIVARRGEPVHRFVLVQSGEVEVWQPDPAADSERLAGELRRGATFGSEVFAGPALHTATYRASVDTEILTISTREVARLRRAGVEIDTRVASALATAQLLAQMPLFANLSQQQIAALVGCMKCAHVDAGQIVVRQGEPRHDFYVVLEGQLTLSVQDEGGDETVIAHLGPGEHFGETALYADQPYAATCRADTPVELLALDEPAFDALVASNRHMAHYVEQVSSGWTLDIRTRLRTVDGRR